MKDNLKIISVLTIITVICGFILAFVFTSAQGKIQENQKQAIYRAITTIVPEAENIQEKTYGEDLVYELKDKNGEFLGYAYVTDGQGYQSTISILFAVDKDIRDILGIDIIESVETPGLGSRITEDAFKDQFKNVPLAGIFEVVKELPQNPHQIQAITSATVSSRAVVSIVNAGIEKLKAILKK
ncbi:MAG: FMN-binding protein [Candidatus Omnitrophica bacterium]|nr:FMN-binding protein [Candidatus Omnitrophota bacterium]